MIVILKPGAQKARVEALMTQNKQQGVDIHYSQGTTETILGLVGDTTHVDEDWLRASDIVEDVRRVSEPYKLANRRFHPKDTHVNVSGRVIGEGTFAVIAGPCSVESREQLVSIAEDVKKSGATCLRGGAFKPRTSPYSFQGLENEGLKLLLEAKRETGLPIVTEIMSETQIDDFADVDVIQVGARSKRWARSISRFCSSAVFLRRSRSG